MCSLQEFEEFSRDLSRWRRELGRSRLPASWGGEEDLRRLGALLGNLCRRLRDGPTAPVRLAFFGPTGAGKSKLFNSLLGATVSPSGFRRPCTRQAVYFLHDDWRLLAPSLEGRVETHRDGDWKDLVLVDTPDFDSVEADNRLEAERVLLESDAVLFITDSLKYADASTWEYLEALRAVRKPCRLVLNKVRHPDAVEDFARRLREHWGEASPEAVAVTFPDLAIDDDELVPRDHGSLCDLRRALDDWLGDGRARKVAVGVFRAELERLHQEAGALLDRLRTGRAELVGIRSRLAQRYGLAAESIGGELPSPLDPALKSEVHRRVLERLEKIDVLRYPRRLIAAPFEGIRRWWMGKRPPEPPAPEDGRTAAASAASFQVLESTLLRLSVETREDIRGVEGWREPLGRSVYQDLCFSHEELLELYSTRLDSFREWVAREAREVAAELTGQNKMTFVLSQVLFNAVLVGVQIHTGGVLTILELGLDSILSPLVAKAVGLAISSDKVRDFEERAHEEHRRLLQEVLVLGRTRFEQFLDRQSEGLGTLESLVEEFVRYRGKEEAMTAHFCGEPKQELALRSEKETGEPA